MKATIVTNPARHIGTIDPLIYGQFLSRRRWVSDEGLHHPGHPAARPDGLRADVVEAVAESAPPIVRWPGGCTGTTYDWRDGIGPKDQRPNVIDAHFGYAVGNGFGTAEFVQFCREIGAEPHINLTTGTGDLREALAWLEYSNLDTDSKWANLRRQHGHAQPFGIKYWQIGNEEWGPWEIGYTTAEHNAARVREWAKSLKKLDPSVKVLALGGDRSHGMLEWTSSVVAEAGKHIDYVTQHRYWNFNSKLGEENYEPIVSAAFIEEQLMRDLGGLIDMVAHRERLPNRPKLAYTEWNCRDVSHAEMTAHWRPSKAQYRLVDALACAGFINAMQRQCNYVTLANFAQTLNVVGMLLVTPEAVLRETVYWALLMQRKYSGNLAIDAWTECDSYETDDGRGRRIAVPYLDVSATLDDRTGRQFVSIVNRHRNDACAIELKTGKSGSAKTYSLTHADPLAMNTFDAPQTVVPVGADLDGGNGTLKLTVPAHSYVIVEV